MISVVQHGLKGSELLRRKFRSMQGCIDPDTIEDLRVDDEQVLDAGASVFEAARGDVRVLVTGVVGEARMLSDGRRQIVALRLPGDILAPAECEAGLGNEVRSF